MKMKDIVKLEDDENRGKVTRTVRLRPEISAWAKNQGWGWLSEQIDEFIRGQMHEDEEYLAEKKKFLEKKLAKVK